jgi:hypothetical protein
MEELSRQKEKERLRKVGVCASIRRRPAPWLTLFRHGRSTSRCAGGARGARDARAGGARCRGALMLLTMGRAQELKKRHEDEKTRLEQLFLKEQAGRRDDQVSPPPCAAHGPAALASCRIADSESMPAWPVTFLELL